MTPDVAGGAGQTVEAVAFDATPQMGSAANAVGAELRIPVPSPKLWSPESPFLYDLRVSLKSGTSTVDQVTRYFGMCAIGLNQVRHPEAQDLGFNLIRKHIKVEPQRWYYWADKLGILVWQDMPSMKMATPTTAARTQFELELREMVDAHRSSPSVIAWVLQNEGWGQYEPARLAPW